MAARVIWITGLPGSGKSVLSDAVKGLVPGLVVLRMDELRAVATPAPTYSEPERDMLYRSLVYMARLVSTLGHDVLIDATGNLRRWRELARHMVPRFAEVYLTSTPGLSRAREAARTERRSAPPDVYKKGDAGWPVPGVGAPYEEPLSPELILDPATLSVDEEARAVVSLLETL
jgi:adenylylsulfate kinase